MAEVFSELFGDMLQRPPSTELAEFPSPQELEYRILLKGPVNTSYYDKDEYLSQTAANKNVKTKPDRMAQQLCDLTYLRSTHLSEVFQASKKPQDISSFSEEKIEKSVSKCAADFVQVPHSPLSTLLRWCD